MQSPYSHPSSSPLSFPSLFNSPPPTAAPLASIPMSPSSSFAPFTTSIDPDEKQRMKKALGPHVSILSSSVARMFVALPLSSPSVEGGPNSCFRYSGMQGAILLVVDRHPPASMHLHLLNLHSLECIFSIQLYANLVYYESNPLFHHFEVSEGCVVGLQFASGFEDEAHAFFGKVREQIPKYADCVAAQALYANQQQANQTKKKSSSSSSFFRRLFSSSSPQQISSPFDVCKQALPSEWDTLFKNAAAANHSKLRKDSSPNTAANSSE